MASFPSIQGIQMKLNVKLLQEVKREILNRPEEFDMNFWGVAYGSKCQCIAGFVWEKEGFGYFSTIEISKTLGLTKNQSIGLFHTDHWKEEYRLKYERCKTQKRKAKVAAEYIDFVCENPSFLKGDRNVRTSS